MSTNAELQPILPEMPPPQAPPTTAQLVESLLFVASEPVSVSQLARTLEVSSEQVLLALSELEDSYVHRGIRLQRHDDQIQLVSAPESATVVARFLGVQAQNRLSAAALEVLAIIAYRQPITRAQVDAIRGVDSSGTIRALLVRELIAEAGRLETVGRPILYTTTPSFLQAFGLTSLAALPPLTTSLAAALPPAEAAPMLSDLPSAIPAPPSAEPSTRFPQVDAGYPHDG